MEGSHEVSKSRRGMDNRLRGFVLVRSSAGADLCISGLNLMESVTDSDKSTHPYMLSRHGGDIIPIYILSIQAVTFQVLESTSPRPCFRSPHRAAWKDSLRAHPSRLWDPSWRPNDSNSSYSEGGNFRETCMRVSNCHPWGASRLTCGPTRYMDSKCLDTII